MTYRTELRVRGYELDGYGHVNHAVYLNYFEHARYDALAQGGFPLETFRDRGWGVHVVRAEVDYARPAVLGDRVRIDTRIAEYSRTRMTLHQAAYREGESPELLARARVTVVWIGSAGRPTRVPAEVKRALPPEPPPEP